MRLGILCCQKMGPDIGKNAWVLLSLNVILLVASVIGERDDRTSEKIYEHILPSSPCFRRMNGTHQIGCGSSLSGDVGILHLISDMESLNWVLEKGPHSPYVAVIYPDKLTKAYMDPLQGSGRVSGVLVLNDTERISGMKQFSPDSTCPNQGSGLYNESSPNYCQKWNEPGEGLMFENYDFPIFYIQKEETSKKVLDCFTDFNQPIDGVPRDWPLCAAQLKSFMLAAVDTPTCLRRSERFNLEQQKDRVCDPTGSINMWSTILPSNQSHPYKNNSVIVISARHDAASMFEGLAKGGASTGAGIATLLAVLKHLSQFKEILRNSTEISNVFFILFQGESFGYIGSSRLVYDMKKGNFPSGIGDKDENVTAKINLDNIKYFFEIGQVGLHDELTPYFLHAPNSGGSGLVSNLLSQAHNLGLQMNKASNADFGFPPSSFQTFLKENMSIPGVLIANHEKGYVNKFFNSMFDDEHSLGYKFRNKSTPTIKVAKLAATIANTILDLYKVAAKVEPDIKAADDLLHCYVSTQKCELFQMVFGSSDGHRDAPLDLYVGVNRFTHTIITNATHLSRVLMMYYQGTNLTSIRTEEDCKNPPTKNVQYLWINRTCIETTGNFSEAVSPAFLIDDYDWKSGQYSSWTESVWQQFSVKIFVKPSLVHEIITLVSGILVFLFSFITVGWVSKKTDIIFPTRPEGMAC